MTMGPNMQVDQRNEVGLPEQPLHEKQEEEEEQTEDEKCRNKPVRQQARGSAMQQFRDGAALYGLCIFLPSIIGVLASFFRSILQQYLWLFLVPQRIILQGWNFLFQEQEERIGVDIILVLLFALILAVLRIILVAVLVKPRYFSASPQKVATLMRCKSTHLLSSASYKFSPLKTSSERRVIKMNTAAAAAAPGAPMLPSEETKKNWRQIFKQLIYRWIARADRIWIAVTNSIRRALGLRARYTDNGLRRSERYRRREQRAVEDETPVQYATAVFRVLFCSASCMLGFWWFSSGEFWPRALLGPSNSKTVNCWDLRGVVAGRLDSDFDHLNRELRFFFLMQAAYQLQSVCFHIASIAALVMVSLQSQNQESQRPTTTTTTTQNESSGSYVRRFLVITTKSYVRPLTEHVLNLTLIVGSYLFAGMRRLGAVGIFTMEFSSIFLHLLLVCINVPPTSMTISKRTLRIFHRYFVMPVFIYFRFYVMPFVVLHSSAFESREWLEQMEKALFPGSGLMIYIVFNALILMIVGLNVIHFRRLLFHPSIVRSSSMARQGSCSSFGSFSSFSSLNSK